MLASGYRFCIASHHDLSDEERIKSIWTEQGLLWAEFLFAKHVREFSSEWWIQSPCLVIILPRWLYFILLEHCRTSIMLIFFTTCCVDPFLLVEVFKWWWEKILKELFVQCHALTPIWCLHYYDRLLDFNMQDN